MRLGLRVVFFIHLHSDDIESYQKGAFLRPFFCLNIKKISRRDVFTQYVI